MGKETKPQEPRRKSRNRSTPQQIDDLPDWRKRLRPQILRTLIDQTHDFTWSRRLITALLEELHVSDEFYNLVDSIGPSSLQRYPQLVAIAMLLRHSWFPEDLDHSAQSLGLPPTLPNHSPRASLLNPGPRTSLAAGAACLRTRGPAHL